MNLKELSAQLGLSQTTVSRAINGYPEVSEDTRARVRAAADLHGYRPSAAARRLATGQSGTLGIIFPAERNNLADLIFTEFLGGCVERAGDLGYDVTLAKARGNISEEAVYRRTVRNARVDAMILSSPLIEDPRPALLHSLGMPFIIHGRTSSTRAVPVSRHRQPRRVRGGDPAVARSWPSPHRPAQRRLPAEFRDRPARRLPAGAHGKGIAVDRRAAVRSGNARRHRLLPGPRLLALAQPPTALLCSSIGQALGVRRAAGERGLTIGRDIALIAHDDRLHELRAEASIRR